MYDKEMLSQMLDNLIQNNADQAKVSFHDFLQSKMQDILGKRPDNQQVEIKIENNKE